MTKTLAPANAAEILALGTSAPPRRFTQDEVFELAGYGRERLRAIFDGSGIVTRSLALETGHRLTNDPRWFAEHYALWAPRLGAEACRKALDRADLDAADVDYLVATSCTGYLCPGLSQLVARELGLGARAKTANLVGQGCNAAVPALERATEFAERHPGSHVLVVSSEVCSATYWMDGSDLESVVGNAIFGDGAAALVVAAPARERVGARRASLAPRIVGFSSRADRELIGQMGFRQEAGRLRVLLSRDVPDSILPLARDVIGELLGRYGLGAREISRWLVHPGGRLILDRLETELGALGVDGGEALAASRRVLARQGNMSSPTVLFVLEESLRARAALPGELGLLVAMGPGLSVEGALIEF
ncbi:MAG: hypothetical protein HY075_10470 [Deltaproteobacteria bacterium]|nr:hypothetical protein [Deltaproteobacteria bacterium]